MECIVKFKQWNISITSLFSGFVSLYLLFSLLQYRSFTRGSFYMYTYLKMDAII